MEPKYELELEGFKFIGRWPEATGSSPGWVRSKDIYMRCIECGELMVSTMSKNYQCSCGSMFLDADYHRFVSKHGDNNVLVYRASKT